MSRYRCTKLLTIQLTGILAQKWVHMETWKIETKNCDESFVDFFICNQNCVVAGPVLGSLAH